MEYNLDEEQAEALNQPETQRPSSCLKRYCNVKIILRVLIVLFSVATIILASTTFHLYKSTKSDYPSSSVTGERKTEKQIGTINHKESVCVRHTVPVYLDNLPDNIDELCEPIKKNVSGTYPGLVPCGVGSNSFIPYFCLCDSTRSCQDGNRDDHYRKRNCSTCRDNLHCPCQNKGKCDPCQVPANPEKISCTCLEGTTGRYCTRISQRLCHIPKSNETRPTEDCRKSNNKRCLSNEYLKPLVCEWSEEISSLLKEPRCSSEKVEQMGTTENVGQQKQSGYRDLEEKETNSDSLKHCLIGIIILSCPILLLFLAYVYVPRRYSFNIP